MVVSFALVQEDPTSSEDFASSDSDVTLYLAIPGGQSSPTDFAAAVALAMVVHFALDQEGQASPCPEYSANSYSVVVLYFANPGG